MEGGAETKTPQWQGVLWAQLLSRWHTLRNTKNALCFFYVYSVTMLKANNSYLHRQNHVGGTTAPGARVLLVCLAFYPVYT